MCEEGVGGRGGGKLIGLSGVSGFLCMLMNTVLYISYLCLFWKDA